MVEMTEMESYFQVSIADALRQVETRRGRGLAEMAVVRELRNMRVEMQRVQNYVESCINAGIQVDAETVLRLSTSCHEAV